MSSGVLVTDAHSRRVGCLHEVPSPQRRSFFWRRTLHSKALYVRNGGPISMEEVSEVKVIRARTLGMCFGVRDAIARARSVGAPEEVTIYGELVHNREVTSEFAARGFAMSDAPGCDSLPDTSRVLITAHGISDRERNRLEAAGKSLIDTTCPLVRRVHEAARRLSRQGYFVVVIGKPGHVEVRGIVGDLRRFAVVAHPGDVRSYDAGRIGVVCQTTTAPVLAQTTLERIKDCNRGKEIAWIPTMCRPTLDRQAAVRFLLRRVDALVVVGGRNSNNTRQIVELARTHGVPAFHVQSSADIHPKWLSSFTTVGLAAGTSTPDETIDAVHARLAAIESQERASRTA